MFVYNQLSLLPPEHVLPNATIAQLNLCFCMAYFLQKKLPREQDAKLPYVTGEDLQRDSLHSPFHVHAPYPAMPQPMVTWLPSILPGLSPQHPRGLQALGSESIFFVPPQQIREAPDASHT